VDDELTWLRKCYETLRALARELDWGENELVLLQICTMYSSIETDDSRLQSTVYSILLSSYSRPNVISNHVINVSSPANSDVSCRK
jgi:hypothetical protein